MGNVKFKALIGVGTMSSACDMHTKFSMPKCTDPFTLLHIDIFLHPHLHYVYYLGTYRHFFIDPLSDLRPDLEESGCSDFEQLYVTRYSFTKFQILSEI